MDVATFAFIVGVWELLIGVPLVLFPRTTFRWLIHAQDNNDVLMRAIGGVFLVIALLVLAEGMAISASVTGVIRLLAWITAIKCLTLCWCPHQLMRLRERLYPTSPVGQRLIGLFAVALGVFMLWASCYLRHGGCCGACG